MNKPLNIAVISHDSKKADMVAFIMKRLSFFKKPEVKLHATGTSGKHIMHAGLEVNCVKSGPLGGDAQIASMLVDGKIDVVLFFIDPMFSHPHEVDIHMLLRLCNVYDVPLATNYSTASRLIKTYMSPDQDVEERVDIAPEEIESAMSHHWSDYEYQEGNLYSTTFADGFKLGVKWHIKQSRKKKKIDV
jgi:methylglyoxal synthase